MPKQLTVHPDFEIAKEEYISNIVDIKDIIEKYNFSYYSFVTWLNRQGISTKKRTVTNKESFKIIDTEEKAYWLGFLYADGNIKNDPLRRSYRIDLTLGIVDKDHVLKFRNFMTSNAKPYHSLKTDCFRVNICSKEIVEDITKLGCYPAKSLTIKYPTVDQVPLDLQHHFIRGLFDGDGGLSFRTVGNGINVYLIGTYEILKGVNDFYNFRSSIKLKVKDSGKNTYQVRYLNEEANILLNSMYNNCTISLDRKKLKYEEFLEYYEKYKVFSKGKYNSK